MKYLIVSDIHGSAYYADQTVKIKTRENADKIIILGDIYNHGPRNPFPKDYNPMEVAKTLNGIKDSLIVVKGNCDSDVDTLISEFDFIPHVVLSDEGKTLFLTHGDLYNKDNLPKTDFDAVIYGHFHTGFIEKVGKTTVANAGSISLPKDGTKNSYLVFSDGVLTLKDVHGKIIKETKI